MAGQNLRSPATKFLRNRFRFRDPHPASKFAICSRSPYLHPYSLIAPSYYKIEEALFRRDALGRIRAKRRAAVGAVRLNIGAYMHSLYRQGAFQVATPCEVYLVKCDAETTTRNDIDRGILNILVAFAPLRPAEFMIIRIQQKARPLEV